MLPTLNTSELLKALDIQFSASAPEFFPRMKTETDRGSRVDTLSYETDDDMPPLTPLKRSNAISSTPTAPALSYSQRHDGVWSIFSPCESVAKKLDWGCEAATEAEAETTDEKETWSPAKITELQELWKKRIVEIRDQKHKEDIEHLVDYIYNNSADTLFEELEWKMKSARSPKDLWIDVHNYYHTTPNGDDLRDKPYTDKEGTEWPTLRNFLNTKGFEALVPGRNVDIHWIVKKTNFLKRLAEKFGAENFTTSYKLFFIDHYDDGVFFFSECSIRLHFWPNGVRTAT